MTGERKVGRRRLLVARAATIVLLLRRVPKRVRACGIALPLLLVLTALTEPRTSVLLRYDGTQVEWSVGGSSARSPARLGTLTAIVVRACPSIYPLGGGQLVVRASGRQVLAEKLARHFHFSADQPAPIGDWWVDGREREEEVFRRSLNVTGPFEVGFVVTGRSLNYVALALEGSPGIVLRWRRFLLNHDGYLALTDGTTFAGELFVPSRLESLRNVANLVLHTLLAAVILVIAVYGLAIGLARALGRLHAKLPKVTAETRRRAIALALGLLILANLLLLLWVHGAVMGGVAHVPDSVAYILQAKWLAGGRAFLPRPAIAENLPVPFTTFTGGKWIAQYPVGWPLLLAIGELLRVPWLVGPICGAAYLFVLFLLGRDMYGPGAGLGAVVLAVLSPVTHLLFASFLSHAAASVFVVLGFWLFHRGWGNNRRLHLVLAAVCLGYCIGIRPLTTVAIMVPLAGVMLVDMIRQRWPRERIGSLLLAAGGGLVGSLPWMVHNGLVTGNPLHFAYQTFFNNQVGIQAARFGVPWTDMTLAYLLPSLYGWGWKILAGWLVLGLTLAFAGVPFLTCRCRGDRVLLASAVTAIGVWAFYRLHGVHGFGPRYYCEAFFAIFLLTARGFQELARTASGPAPHAPGRRASALLVTGALALALGLSTACTLRERLLLFRGYNEVGGLLPRAIAAAGITRGVVVFTWRDWYPWGDCAPLLPARLDEPLVFAASAGDNSALVHLYPDRLFYRWDGVQLVKIDKEELLSADKR